MRPVVLTILDGWGYSPQQVGNAIATAGTPTLDDIARNYPSMLLQASGSAVGMSHGEAGNSEVGHLTLGAGRVIFQYLSRINKLIENGEFFKNQTLLDAAAQVQKNSGTLHIAGLLTSGAVHAYYGHLIALIKFAKDNNLPYRLHLFLDGRDSGLKEGADLLKKLSGDIGGLDNLATLIGRDYAMDRDNNWKLTETAYNLMVNVTGNASQDIFATLTDYYHQNINDGNIPATVLHASPVKSGDAVLFFNFREDSMRQLARVFTEPGFNMFLPKLPDNLYISAMTQYTESEQLHVVIPPPEVKNCLAEVLGANGKKHLHIAETEKYAHVTFFFNGLHNKPFDGESDIFIESPEDLLKNPEMQAAEIADKVCAELDAGSYDFYVINFANGDMLAHLGVLEAAEKGVKVVDTVIGKIKDKILEKNGLMLITADHGNVESMIYKSTGEKETRHDDNPVPLYLIGAEYAQPISQEKLEQARASVAGLLSDVAPTVLELMGLPQPAEMTGQSLLKELP